MSSSSSTGKGASSGDVVSCFTNLVPGCDVVVHAMVCRKWDAHNPFGKYLGTEFILSDSQGQAIQCSARSNISHRFVSKLVEGSVYSFKKFSVVPNREKFRVRKMDDHIICLEGYIFVKKLSIPADGFARFPFDLIPLEDIELNDSMYLIDVIGCVVEVGKIRTTTGGSELLECELMNERSTRVRVTLWAPLCNELMKRKGGAVDPYVVVLPAMNVKEFRGDLFLSSTSATVLFDALDIPQISSLASVFKASLGCSPPSKPVVPAVITGLIYQLLRTSRDQSGTKKKPVTFHCKGRVQDIRTKDGWFYFSCGRGGCKKRVSRSGSKFMCQTCSKVCEFPRTSYRLHLTIADATGTVVVTMFDDVASKLLGKSAAQLLSESEGDDDESVIPPVISALSDTTHTFEIKSNSYYDQGTYESFTVTSVPSLHSDKLLPLKRSHSDVDDTTSSNNSQANSVVGTGDLEEKVEGVDVTSSNTSYGKSVGDAVDLEEKEDDVE